MSCRGTREGYKPDVQIGKNKIAECSNKKNGAKQANEKPLDKVQIISVQKGSKVKSIVVKPLNNKLTHNRM